MDVERDSENFLFNDIIKNLNDLLIDDKSENDGSNSADTKANQQIDLMHNQKPKKTSMDHQQMYLSQLQIMSFQILHLQRMNNQRMYQNQKYFDNFCCVWSGSIPLNPQIHHPVYSKKIFLGGIPWNYSESDVKKMLHNFGQLKIEWPIDEQNNRAIGFTYVIFESERKVKMLLNNCKKEGNYCSSTNSYYHKIVNSKKFKSVEIIPWIVTDAYFSYFTTKYIDNSRTAFIGGLHGKMTAYTIAKILNDLFGGVENVVIDVDENNYPKGAGHVVFNDQDSYMRAICAKFVQVKAGSIQKKLQIDPFVQISACSLCGFQLGKFFCRDMNCFCYFCSQCWNLRHSVNIFQGHTALTRDSNSQQQYACKNKQLATKKNPIKPFVTSIKDNKESINKNYDNNASSMK